MDNFTVKRGMVFFIEDAAKQEPISCNSESAPKKRRPYIVLSNDKCNASSPLIHVAPILTREYDPKRWYCVPFKSTCNRDSVVDVSAIMLLDKSICNEVNYSEAISQYTYGNQILMDNVKTAIKRQFSVDDSDYYDNYTVAASKSAVSAINRKSESVAQQIAPSIHLTINLNGVPVGTTVSAEAVSESTVPVDEPVVAVEEPVKIVADQSTRKIVKAVKEVERKLFNTVETNTDVSNELVKLSKNYILTDDSAKIVNDYILEHHKYFGGTMSGTAIAAHFNVAVSTINRRAKKLLGEVPRKYLVKNAKKGTKKSKRAHLPENLHAQFAKDYADYGSKYCIKTYAKYGFKSASQVYNLVARIEKKKVSV